MKNTLSLSNFSQVPKKGAEEEEVKEGRRGRVPDHVRRVSRVVAIVVGVSGVASNAASFPFSAVVAKDPLRIGEGQAFPAVPQEEERLLESLLKGKEGKEEGMIVEEMRKALELILKKYLEEEGRK